MNSLAPTFNTVAGHPANASHGQLATAPVPTIKDLLEDGIYLLFLLRSKNFPSSCGEFNQRVDQYLNTFERICRAFNKPIEAIIDAKYAFCALLDEIILSSGLPIRDEWEQAPLQLRLFGEHLAGDGFFDKLEKLRQDPSANIELLEVFHTCLLLGFQGRYLLEGTEKLNYVIAKLTQEIASVRGPAKGFAPNCKLPFQFNEYVRHELPMWLYYALLAVSGVVLFLVFQWLLNNQMKAFPKALPVPATRIEQRQTLPVSTETQTGPEQRRAAPATSETQSAPPGSTEAKKLEESKFARDVQADLKSDAESEANSLQNSARSKTRSAVNSLFR